MSIESQLQMIHDAAKSGTKDGKTCRDVLLSLWDDGVSHGCDLRELLSLDRDHYCAVQQVLESFYNNSQQLDQFMTTRQITALDEVDYGAKKRQPRPSALSVANPYGKVRMKR